MSDLDVILAILTGKKVRNGNKWKVYDANDVEIVDADGVLLSGLHGFLLNNQFGSVGAGSYDSKKRRRNIVNVDGVLYEFATEAEAISFLNLQDESVPVAEKVTQPVPIKTVNIETVESLSESAIINATPNEIYNYIQFADYAAIIKAYDQWLELDEEEALLLLM